MEIVVVCGFVVVEDFCVVVNVVFCNVVEYEVAVVEGKLVVALLVVVDVI